MAYNFDMRKDAFEKVFVKLCEQLQSEITDAANKWTIKGFIDTKQSVFTISQDTKIISKILELHILPQIVRFADTIDFNVVLADHQNYYPDMTFVSKSDSSVKYAVDIKTTFRRGNNAGFTLGSHGAYFINRSSTKNIQFPYQEYKAHYVLGIIYDRNEKADEREVFTISDSDKINSVIKNLQVFFAEKWKIAGDKQGSGNTANIGSVTNMNDLINGTGIFTKYTDGEKLFDDYWMNYGKISVADKDGKTHKIVSLKEFIKYRGGDNQ